MMTALPERVVGRASQAEHGLSFAERKRNQGNHNHAPRFALDVRNGIERNLAAKGRSGVASDFGDEGVGRFVASGGEKKGNVPDESESEQFGREVRHGKSLGFLRASSVEVTVRVCKGGEGEPVQCRRIRRAPRQHDAHNARASNQTESERKTLESGFKSMPQAIRPPLPKGFEWSCNPEVAFYCGRR